MIKLKTSLFLVLFAWTVLAIGAVTPDELNKTLDTERMSLNLEQAEVSDVFKTVQLMVATEVDLQCKEQRNVTIKFSELTIRAAIQAICESAGLTWKIETTPKVRIVVNCLPDKKSPLPSKESPAISIDELLNEKLDYNLFDVPFQKIMGNLKNILQIEVQYIGDFKSALINIEVKDMTLKAFLDEACKQISARWRFEKGATPLLIIERSSIKK
jgi:hypothetical protein